MVFICMPLSRRAMQLSLLTLNLAMFLIPYHQWKGWGFKKGICTWHCTSWAFQPGVPSAWSPFLEGPRLPSLAPSPPFGLNVDQFWMPSPASNHGWNASGCCNGSSVSPPAEPPSLPWQAALWIPQSCLQFNWGLHSWPLFLVGTVFFQMCHPYSRGPGRLGAFQLS